MENAIVWKEWAGPRNAKRRNLRIFKKSCFHSLDDNVARVNVSPSMRRSRDFFAKYTNRVRKLYNRNRLEQYHRLRADLFEYAEIEREFA